MKNILLILLTFFSSTAGAQDINAARFKADFQAIVEDALKGFPAATGTVKEDIGWFGRKYESRMSVFGKPEWAGLQWIKAQDNKYSAPTPEQFYFSQSFPAGSAEAKFVAAEGAAILDEAASGAGLKKFRLKMRGDYKHFDKTAWGTSSEKPAFTLSRNKNDGSFSLTVYSGYRPGDVKVPNLLGCMVFTSSSTSFMYIMPVYGATAPDKNTLASRAMAASGLTSDHNYTWYPGRSSNSLEKEFGKSMSIRLLNAYSVD